MKFVVIDDLLSEENRISIYNLFSFNQRSRFDMWYDLESLPSCLLGLRSFIQNQFNIDHAVGYECWTHYNSRPGNHIDKDEYQFGLTGEIVTSICSLIYYPYISDDLQGGLFVTDSIAIKPKTNRAIVMSSGVPHSVETFSGGDRFSLLLNPWHYKPQYVSESGRDISEPGRLS